jgi:hypothetical protein
MCTPSLLHGLSPSSPQAPYIGFLFHSVRAVIPVSKQAIIPHQERRLQVKRQLYSYPYLNQQNPLFLPIIAYTLSTTKLEIRAK